MPGADHETRQARGVSGRAEPVHRGIIAGHGIDEDSWVLDGGQKAQDLRQIGAAEFAGSASTVGIRSQPDLLVISHGAHSAKGGGVWENLRREDRAEGGDLSREPLASQHHPDDFPTVADIGQRVGSEHHQVRRDARPQSAQRIRVEHFGAPQGRGLQCLER